MVGALTGALASLPTTFFAMKIVRKGSNVLLLAPPDQQRLEQYARAFGSPMGGPGGLSMGPHGPGCKCGSEGDSPNKTGQYL